MRDDRQLQQRLTGIAALAGLGTGCFYPVGTVGEEGHLRFRHEERVRLIGLSDTGSDTETEGLDPIAVGASARIRARTFFADEPVTLEQVGGPDGPLSAEIEDGAMRVHAHEPGANPIRASGRLVRDRVEVRAVHAPLGLVQSLTYLEQVPDGDVEHALLPVVALAGSRTSVVYGFGSSGGRWVRGNLQGGFDAPGVAELVPHPIRSIISLRYDDPGAYAVSHPLATAPAHVLISDPEAVSALRLTQDWMSLTVGGVPWSEGDELEVGVRADLLALGEGPWGVGALLLPEGAATTVNPEDCIVVASNLAWLGPGDGSGVPHFAVHMLRPSRCVLEVRVGQQTVQRHARVVFGAADAR